MHHLFQRTVELPADALSFDVSSEGLGTADFKGNGGAEPKTGPPAVLSV